MAGARFFSESIQSPQFRECWSFINLIPNPTMKSGWNCTGSSSPAGYGTNCYSIKLTGTTSTYEATTNTYEYITLYNTHIYYARVYGKQDTVCGSVGFYWPIAEPSLQDGIPIQAAGAWRMYSTLNNRSSFTNGSKHQFRLDFNNNQVSGDIWYSSPMLIDLTATFGAGKEPDKTWCDNNLPYFERSYEISVTKIASILSNEMQSKKFTEGFLPSSISANGVSTGKFIEQ